MRLSTVSELPRPSNGRNLTVEALAEAKRLPAEFLRDLGLHDLPQGGVGIRYCGPAGEEIAVKRRTALKAKDGSYWPKGKPLAAYGQWRLDWAKQKGFLILVEGESDCWALWHNGLPALGLPGANTAKTLLREHLEAVPVVYVHCEPDQGGPAFVQGVRERLAALGFAGKTFELRLPEGIKDLADLHAADPAQFLARLQSAITASTPLALSTTPTSANPAAAARLLQLAGEAKADRLSRDGALERLRQMNTGRPPLPAAEVERLVDLAYRRPEPRRIEEEPLDEPEWPKPLAAEAFHGLAGETVREIEPHSEADPVALLVQLLDGFGNRIGRTAHFKAEGDTHYLNLFVVLVGRTASGRKGTAWGRVRQVLEPVEPDWLAKRVQGGLASGEGMVYAIRDEVRGKNPIKGKGGRIEGYQEIITDHGEPDKRLLCLEEEYAGVLRMLERQGNSLSARIRDAWQGKPIGSLTKHSPTKCREPHVSIIGHVTADEIRRYLTTTEMANGFGNRHQWFAVKRSKSLPDGGRWAPSPDLIRRWQAAADHAVSVGELQRDARAREVWHAVYPELSEGKPGLVGCMLGRAIAQVMRLACLYAVLDLAREIRAEHLTAALALWDFSEQSVRFIFGDSLGDPVADDIIRALRKTAAGLTREEIRDLFGRHRSAADIGRALGLLLQCGLADRRREATAGRPAERWFAVGRGARKATEAR